MEKIQLIALFALLFGSIAIVWIGFSVDGKETCTVVEEVGFIRGGSGTVVYEREIACDHQSIIPLRNDTQQ